MLKISSDFLKYLASFSEDNQDELGNVRLPSLSELSKELGISVASLREQVEVAKAIGLVEVRPRTGIRRLPYSFLPAVLQSLSYAIAVDETNFLYFSDLRNHVEASYWDEAVRILSTQDFETLNQLMESAWNKLNGNPIQIPHTEHRQLHLSIFAKLENPFVLGLLEAYWEAYEAVGLNLYADYNYLCNVWNYHQNMVDAICLGDYEFGYKSLVEHKDLLQHHPNLEDVRNEGQ
jgi:DNA-binding FadR family transcriptional regulator